MFRLKKENLNDFLAGLNASRVFFVSDKEFSDDYPFADRLIIDSPKEEKELIYELFEAIDPDCDVLLVKGDHKLVETCEYIARKLRMKFIVDGQTVCKADGIIVKEIKEKDISEVLKDIKLFVLDMDGTIYLDGELFSFTKDFLQAVKQSGRDYCFYTNNSSKNKLDYLDRLNNLGIPTADERMLLSTEVIIEYLKSKYSKDTTYYVIGTPSLINAFKEAGLKVVDDNPDVVILGFDTTLTYEKLSKGCHYIRNGCDYYGVNADYNCPMKDGAFIPDCGSMAKLIERSTGRFPEFFGKPSRYTLEYIKKITGYKEEEIAFVGDRIYTDIKVAEGTKATSIMVLTGESTKEDIYRFIIEPDVTVESLETLIKYL